MNMVTEHGKVNQSEAKWTFGRSIELRRGERAFDERVLFASA
jgi:hypothetical protein